MYIYMADCNQEQWDKMVLFCLAEGWLHQMMEDDDGRIYMEFDKAIGDTHCFMFDPNKNQLFYKPTPGL